MLASYAKGVNKEQQRIGSLFRKGTKAFKQFSDFPSHVKRKFEQFRKFFAPSRLVKFKESTQTFLNALENSLRSADAQLAKLHLFEALHHPKVAVSRDYLLLRQKFNPT